MEQATFNQSSFSTPPAPDTCKPDGAYPLPQKQASNTPTIMALVALAVTGIIAIVLVSIFRDEDNTLLITTIIGFIGSITAGLLATMRAQDAYVQARETHLLVNSRMSEFIETLKKTAEDKSIIAKAEGRVEGIEDANQRIDELKATQNEQ